MLGDRARCGFEGLGVSVGRTAGFGFGFDGVGGFEVGLGIEEVIGVLALGRGIESEDITRGRGLLGSIGWMTGKWEGVGGRQRPETEHDRQLKRFIVNAVPWYRICTLPLGTSTFNLRLEVSSQSWVA